jgi:hypothetical protein
MIGNFAFEMQEKIQTLVKKPNYMFIPVQPAEQKTQPKKPKPNILLPKPAKQFSKQNQPVPKLLSNPLKLQPPIPPISSAIPPVLVPLGIPARKIQLRALPP